MGGYRSGRTGGWPTVESCGSLILDVDRVTRPIRDAMRRLGMKGIADGKNVKLEPQTIRWTRWDEDEPWATVEIRLEFRSLDGTAWLRYDIEHYHHDTGPQEYPVSMMTTPCRYGGHRWWWVCPATGRWVRKLYLPNGGNRFLSRGRGGYMLAYASQRQGHLDRIHARSRILYRKLGADYNGPSSDTWPPKPKGMHWRTYDAICDKLELEAQRMNLDLLRLAEKWNLFGR